ncbi:MAG: hypothetical protein ACOZCL_18315 [Bacillota bacterium]
MYDILIKLMVDLVLKLVEAIIKQPTSRKTLITMLGITAALMIICFFLKVQN